jgi:acetyl-CoA synthetase
MPPTTAWTVNAGHGDRVAFYWHGEQGEQRTLTYAQILADTQRLANALKARGVGKGDIVGIYLPMIPEVVVAMLACARIGAPHNVVFGGFAPSAVQERMAVSKAKALITADGARRRGKTAPVKQAVDEAIADLDTLQTVVVVRSTGAPCEMQDGRDHWYHELLADAEPECPAEPMEAEHPLFLLYSSGSTAKPKGIVHTTGGYLTGVTTTAAMVFDLDTERDVFWCTADVGWITGHSYIVYGPMANGVTSVMYEGAPDYPDKDAWWQVVEKYRVSIFYTAPTAIRACMKWGEQYPGRHDLSSLRLLGTVGEPINPKAWVWYYAVIGGERCPVVDTWWQTETGAIMISPLPGITPMKAGSATRPLPGVSASLLDENGNEVREGAGLLVLTQPWPSMLRTLYDDPDRYVETYFSRFGPRTYFVGDGARRDEDGYFWITGRIDDVINVSGHRLSTAEIESALVAHTAVAEAAVVAVNDDMTGQSVVAYVTVVGELEPGPDLVEELREHVSARIGKFARPQRVIWSADLPKTRSGKIMRRLLRDIADGRELGDVTTLGDPSVVEALQKAAAEGGSER